MNLWGWAGKILEVDLDTLTFRTSAPEPELLREWIGGRGLAGHFLAPGAALAFDAPETPLLLFTGPLVHTASPTSGRFAVMSISPLTNTVCDASVGGSLGVEMKRAGWDGLVITGRAKHPVGIGIRDSHAEFVQAGHLAGKTTTEIGQALEGKGAVLAHGPAALHGVRFASLMADRHHAAGRGGLGLVMARKNLAFVTVRGSGKTRVYDPKGLAVAREDVFRLIAASPALLGGFGIARHGTAALVDLISSRAMTPTANFRRTYYPFSATLNAPAMHAAYPPKRAGCRGCHIQCKKRAGDAWLPEYETLSHFTALIENPDLAVCLEASRLCNEYGMDTISMGSALACHAELRGAALSGKEVLDLVHKTGRGEDAGLELGQGAARMAAGRGRPELAMAVKGLDLPAYDPRGAYGMALAYAVSTRGGCHLRAYPISHEILRKPAPTDRFSFDGKARIIKNSEDMCAAVDSLTACKFVFFAAGLEEYARVYSAVTGVSVTGQDLQRTGERIYFRERMMNAARGFRAGDDALPERFFTAPENGPGEPTVPPLPREEFFKAREKYYRARGLDADGMPLREKMEDLGFLEGRGLDEAGEGL
jgi:aldehyde:ferredoxin oxidoreductase